MTVKRTRSRPTKGLLYVALTVGFLAVITPFVWMILGSFKGALGPDGKTLTGAWSQGGVELPLTLTRK